MAQLIHIRRVGLAAIVAGFAGLAFLAPNAALAAEVKIGGKPLSFEPPSGVCLFDKKNATEGRVVTRLREFFAPSEVVAWAFINCDQKDAWLKRPDFPTKSFGVVAVTKRKAFVEAAASMTRAQYIASVADIKLWQPIYRDLDTRARNAGMTIKPTQLISLDTDEAATYIGSISTVMIGRQWITDITLSARTIINGLPVEVMLSRPDATVDDILPELKALTRAMIERNERRPAEQSDVELSSYRNEDVRPVVVTN